MQVEWHGTPAETLALNEALTRECECRFTADIKISNCAGHEAMIKEQRFLDGLLFARNQVKKLLEEEFFIKEKK